jgi:hypothetical protein
MVADAIAARNAFGGGTFHRPFLDHVRSGTGTVTADRAGDDQLLVKHAGEAAGTPNRRRTSSSDW